MEDLRRILGYRIRAARLRLSITQKRLAELAGLPAPQIVSQIEKGEREVKAWELVNLAKILHVEVSDLLSTEETEPLPIVLWRKYPQRNRELIESDFLQRCQQYAFLERLCEADTEQDLPEKKVEPTTMTFGDAEQFAEYARQEFDLGSRPATSLVGMLEDRYGVKIWYQDLGEEGSAASTKGSFGPAILVNSAEVPWRRNFSLAHELFHLMTWENFPAQLLLDNSELWDKTEQLANVFASSLLLPSEGIKLALNKRVKRDKISLTDLIEIAREFDVSTDALLFRFVNLGFLDRDTVERLRADRAFKALDRGARHGKRPVPPAIPERFVRLAFMAYQKGRLSRPRLAQYLNTSLIDLTDTLLEYGFDDREDYQAEVRAPRC